MVSGTASDLGEKMLELGGQNHEKMFDNLFTKTGCRIIKEEFVKMQECANMLEKYVSRFQNESEVVCFDSQDMYRLHNKIVNKL